MHSKCGLIICFANIKDWLKSARTWLLIFFFMLLCYMEVSGVLLNMHRENMTLHIAEIPYYF